MAVEYEKASTTGFDPGNDAAINTHKAATDHPDHGDLDKSITVDTVHNDEGVKVLANYHGDQMWTEAEEKSLVKKIDRRLLSIVVTTYGLQYYDKAMLSQAVSIPRPNL